MLYPSLLAKLLCGAQARALRRLPAGYFSSQPLHLASLHRNCRHRSITVLASLPTTGSVIDRICSKYTVDPAEGSAWQQNRFIPTLQRCFHTL